MSDETPPKSPSSMRLERWGLCQAWLCMGARREIVIRVDARGHLLVVVNSEDSAEPESVRESEDPSQAALRAIGRISQ